MGELAAGGMAIDPECLDLGSRPLANFPEQRIKRREGPLVTRTKVAIGVPETRSDEHTSELQSLMLISYAVCCLKNNIAGQDRKRKRLNASHNNASRQPSIY